MKHYGDITKISGYDVPIVDVITGGSPCQDLSVAGKRAGLEGERSGLFMEQVRIVKEMRERDRAAGRTDEYIRPRYMVWENVPGAFSSNGGKDFQAVLTEIVRIAEPEAADVPMPTNGKWTKSGCLYDNLGGWSIAWRVHDAQFWGVPQRRKRIALVADFGGLTAPEILFERKGLSRDSEQGEQKRKETARTTGESPDESSYTLKIRGGVERDSYGKRAGKGALIQKELSGTLGVSQDQTLFPFMNPPEDEACLNSWDVQSKHVQPVGGIAESLYAGECRYGGGESYVFDDRVEQNPDSGCRKVDIAKTHDCFDHNPAGNQGGIVVLEGNGARDSHYGDGYKESEVMYTLNTVEQHAIYDAGKKLSGGNESTP